MLASLIERATEKFDFKDNNSNAVRILYLELFFEVNKPFATDLFAFGNFGSLSMATLKTVLRALCSYGKKHVLCEPKSKSFSVSKGIVFENHIKACVYFCIKRYLVEQNSYNVRCATKGTYLRVHLPWANW